MKKLTYLAMAALVAMVIFVPSAFAQATTGRLEQTVMRETTQPLPASGGMVLTDPALVLPAVALLLGSWVLGYAVLRRR